MNMTEFYIVISGTKFGHFIHKQKIFLLYDLYCTGKVDSNPHTIVLLAELINSLAEC
jgi:hypothetical protein